MANVQHLPRIDSKNLITESDIDYSENAATLAAAPASTTLTTIKPPPSSDSDSIVLLDPSSSSSSNSMRFSASSDSEHDDAAAANADVDADDAELPALVADGDDDESDEKLLDIVVAYTSNEAKLGDAVAAELVRRGVLDEEEGQELGAGGGGGAVAAEPAGPESVARQGTTPAEGLLIEQHVERPEVVFAGEEGSLAAETVLEPMAREASPVATALLSSDVPIKPATSMNDHLEGTAAVTEIHDTDLPVNASTTTSTENPISRVTYNPTAASSSTETPGFPLPVDDYSSSTIKPPPPPVEPTQPKSILEEIYASIFTPGVNPRVQSAMNMSFAGLFVSLALLAVVTGFNIHVFGLMGVAVCLFASVQW
ncbi:hypothetical protein HDU86_003055 [Geranomyces michiganensis]|nr:hypothetical protein HDU86_003055 [Geranomyces michiganensis]